VYVNVCVCVCVCALAVVAVYICIYESIYTYASVPTRFLDLLQISIHVSD